MAGSYKCEMIRQTIHMNELTSTQWKKTKNKPFRETLECLWLDTFLKCKSDTTFWLEMHELFSLK